MRNISADDLYKSALCSNGGAELMLKVGRKGTHGVVVVVEGWRHTPHRRGGAFVVHDK